MMKMTQRKYLFAIFALVLTFAGCKGESPTAPSQTGSGSGTGTGTGTTTGGSGGTGTTPPTGATVTLSVSNANPLAGSTTVVTATVTVNNAPAPNGTAVEFSTAPQSFATFTDTNAQATIRTTTSGVATATLTAATAGTATVQAVVNNVAKSTTVTFTTTPVNPPPASTAPTLTSVAPATGQPAGGQTVVLNGTNFKAPVRVLFDVGNGVAPKEAFVVSVTSTQITVVTPSFDIGTGQTAAAGVTVITNAGTTSEQRVALASAFTYQLATLTPSITTLSPASGPIDGGTRITIFGDAFQAPVQVFFGSAEAQVVSISFKQLVVISPAGRDTASNGSGAVTGPIDVRVININSNTNATLTGGFRYTPKTQVTAMGPTEGPYYGGTRVTIDGIGFTDPVAVVIGGIAAQPIKVSGTEIIAITGAVSLSACADIVAPSSVTNIDNGDSTPALPFTYRVPKPVVASVIPSTSPAVQGTSVSVTVLNAELTGNRILIGGIAVPIVSQSTTSDGSITTFTVNVPAGLVFSTNTCQVGTATGTIAVPTGFDVTYLNVPSTCTDTAVKILQVSPPASAAVCSAPSAPVAAVTQPASGCAAAGSATSGGGSSSTTIVIKNTATGNAQNLTISGATITGANASEFTIAPTSASIGPSLSQVFTVTFTPTSTGSKSAQVTFTTNDPAHATITVCLTGTGT